MFELKVLNLSHNHLFQIDGKMQLNPYFNLQTLDLSHNHLSHGPASAAFRTVSELYLQNNEFIEFDFRSSENLRNVYLSNNEWSCKKIEAINKTTVIADQFHGECLSGFVKKKGICCREYKKPYIQRLNEVLTEALFHNQTNQQRLATKCRSRPSSSRPEILNENELTRLRNEAATGDDANKKLIDELWNITNLHKNFTEDIKRLEVERNILNSQQTALKTAIEQQRQFYAIVKEGLISDQEKLTRILQYLKEREILNAELVTAREQDTLETDDDLKYIKQEKSDFEKSLADMKTIVEQLEKEETEKKKQKDDLERKANRHSVRIHGSSERVS
ncbi:uncharacterized protein LOC128734576 [Sabethes cyaneus]|uniref:uncharacterized protein LOC128734576 n=1 Tax=Sabethes cyaneus TaxID=53552 RepID=UPI00237EA498|nr:uncharacterized protein LOC128734576 [Sabethes cyaneus]